MTNREIAEILSEIGTYLSMDEVQFKPRAYEKAATAIGDLGRDILDIYKEGGLKALEEIPGVGTSIGEKIEELLKTGQCQEYEKLKKKMPVNLAELSKVEGLGPKGIKVLYQKLKIKNLKDLAEAAQKGKIRKLEHFGEKSEQKIIKALEFLNRSAGRFLLYHALPMAKKIEDHLRRVSGVKEVTVAGSIRRKQETIGDIDILATAKDPKKVIAAFLAMPERLHTYGVGPTKSSVRLKNGLDADLRVLPDDVYGAALQYFTGDKMHNIEVRKIAIKKGYKLSEYGLFKGKKIIAAKTEEVIYEKLGMQCPPPEIRTNTGEIEAALKHKLPKLIDYGSLRGDLQIQTKWTDGANSILEMAEAAHKAGLEYIAITDHTKSLAMTGGLDEKELARQAKEIDKINSKFKIQNSKFRVLKGSEVDIKKDGSLDLNDEALSKLHIIGVSIHSHFNLSEKEQTERVIKALKNPYVNIFFHPTGRLIDRRPPANFDMAKVLRVAREYGVAMEINASADRLDLKDVHIRMAVELGGKLIIDSDAHNVNNIGHYDLAIAQARRGWAKQSDVLNTLPLKDFLASLRRLKK